VSRIFEQKNVWGSQGGLNPQRADLWFVDFTQVLRGINAQLPNTDNTMVVLPLATLVSPFYVTTALAPLGSRVEPYYVASVSLPSLGIKAEEIRRDSRPYMMPGFDDPLSEIKVVFILESPVSTKNSKIYQFLDTWRAFTRAGRGAMGNEKTVTLNSRFTVVFRFPVSITLLRGNANPTIQTLAVANAQLPVSNDVEDCGVWQLENMWLSRFRATDLDYSKGNEIVRIEATFYADNIRDLNQQ
jgi:hypothetical protein